MWKRKIKNLIVAALACSLFVAAVPAAAFELHDTGLVGDGRPIRESEMPITIHLDGEYLPSEDVDPIIINGRTMIPLRLAGEALGAQVTWNSLSRSVTVTKDDRVVYFFLNSNTYYIDDVAYQTDVSPTIISGRTILPLRAFAEALDADVTWDGNLYDVAIDTAAPDADPVVVPNGTNPDAAVFVKKYYVRPDASDPFVGSWAMVSSDVNITKAGSAKFISKLSDGTYQMVLLSFDDQWNGPVTAIDVIRYDAWRTPNGNTPAIRVHNTQNYLYYIGAWFSLSPWTDSYDDYMLVGDQLLCYQSTNISSGSAHVGTDLYPRF